MKKILRKLLSLLYTFFAWSYVIWAITTHFFISLITSPFYKNKELTITNTSKKFLKLGLFILQIPVKVTGKNNIPKGKTFLFVSNHQSHIDIPVLMASIPKHFAFVAKKQLFKIPILGWELKNQGHIMINRENSRQAVQQIEATKNAVKNGKSVLFFPEGTRSKDGSIGRFKKGAFQIAVQTNTPIIPCCITGSNKSLTKKSLTMTPNKIHLNIGEPIYFKQPKDKAEERALIEELTSKTKQKITQMLT